MKLDLKTFYGWLHTCTIQRPLQKPFLRSLPSPCCLGWLCRSLPKIAWAKNPCWFKPAHPFARMPWVVAGFTYHILWWWDDRKDGLWGVNIDQISQVLWEFCGIPRDVPGLVEQYFRDMTIAGTLSDLTSIDTCVAMIWFHICTDDISSTMYNFQASLTALELRGGIIWRSKLVTCLRLKKAK